MSDRGEKLPPLDDEHKFEAMEIVWKLATEGRTLTDAEFIAECKRLEDLGWYYDPKASGGLGISNHDHGIRGDSPRRTMR